MSSSVFSTLAIDALATERFTMAVISLTIIMPTLMGVFPGVRRFVDSVAKLPLRTQEMVSVYGRLLVISHIFHVK